MKVLILETGDTIYAFTNTFAFTNVEGTGTDDDRKMMDNLLAKLRSADAEPTVTRTRRRRQQTKEEEQVRDDDVQLAENLLKSLQSD